MPLEGTRAGKVEAIGAQGAHEGELGQLGLDRLGAGGGGPGAQPHQRGGAQPRLGLQQPVERDPAGGVEHERLQPLEGLGPGSLAGGGHPTHERVDGRADHPLGPQVVARELDQQRGTVVLEGPGQEEVVEALQLASPCRPPAQAFQHLPQVVPARV